MPRGDPDDDDDGDIDIEKLGVLAKVHHVSKDLKVVHFTYNNGMTGRASGQQLPELTVGDIVLVDAESNRIEPAPSELWPREEPTIGVIRLVTPDTIVVDSGGRWHGIPSDTNIEAQRGNTVEFTSKGLLRKRPRMK